MHELRLDFGERRRAALLEHGNAPDLRLREFLSRFPARSAEPIPPDWLDLPLRSFHIVAVNLGTQSQGPAPLRSRLDVIFSQENPPAAPVPPTPPGFQPPAALSDNEAVAYAYADEIKQIGRYLSSDLSVLVICDKVLTEHIYRQAVRQSGKEAVLEDDPTTSEPQSSTAGALSAGLLQQQMLTTGTRIANIGRLLGGLKSTQVLVLRHIDLLAGGSADAPLSPAACLLTEVLYRSHDFTPTLLGFVDSSLGLPKVLADRFAVRVELAGLKRESIPYLVTVAERDQFAVFDAEMLFKNVSGFNAIQFRNAMRYLHASSTPGSPTRRLMEIIRQFKRGSSDEIEIPDISFDQIGGYIEVKHELFEAIELITGKPVPYNPDGTPCSNPPSDSTLPGETEAQRIARRKLAPRGFIFHGPPGTGKTLFAKAVANAMNATIQMVSGPEIMDMWVGRSESNIRRIFAVARRNAPAVIFFDEFDSIAIQRTSFGDGGSRTSNAVVAQLLTEMDGFREEQDILVIGTTNRLDIIDEALLRPARFQPIEIGLPDEQARRKIAEIHAANFHIALPTSHLLDLVVEYTQGFSGDEIRAIFQGLARKARLGEPVTIENIARHIGAMKRRHEELRRTQQTGYP